MLALRNPHEAYRRVDFDARIQGADPAQLVVVCYEQAGAAIAAALFAHGAGDNLAKSRAITQALSAITALQLGLRGDGGVTDALNSLFGAARKTLLDSAINFNAGAVTALRQDLAEVGAAMAAAAASAPLTTKQDS